jgi:hypothetical protein
VEMTEVALAMPFCKLKSIITKDPRTCILRPIGTAPELSCMAMFLRLKHHHDEQTNTYKSAICTWVEYLELIGFATTRGGE